MMLKKTDTKKLRFLKRKVRSLQSDLDSIITEHDLYTFESDSEAAEWFHSFPIETLEDSLLMENDKPRKQISLQDMLTKSSLRKKYYEDSELLEKTMSDLNIAHIDLILSKINNLLEN